jgi:hypothetical protein
VAQLTNRQRLTIGGAVVVFLGALIAAAALAQSTRNQSDPTPTNGTLFAATSPSPTTVVVSPVPKASPPVTVTSTVTLTTRVTTTRAETSVVSVPSSVNAGTGGQAWIGGLSPGAAVLGIAGVSVLAVGGALMAGRRTGARL